MKPISCSKIFSILNLFDSGHMLREIASTVEVSLEATSNIIKEHRHDSPKPAGGRQKKLPTVDIHHATHLISSGKADTADQVHKVLQDTANISCSVQRIRGALGESAVKSAVKRERSFLSKKHRRVGWTLQLPMLTGLWRIGIG